MDHQPVRATLIGRSLALLLGGCACASASERPEAAARLLDLSLEELGGVEVTSASRRPQRLVQAATSIFVITGDELRRSGVSSLPEALRLAPNLQVARIGASGYAISARGFNNSVGNKLQVLLDGRVLYTPLFSGVFWDTPDVLLEDVLRIEVISGPAATLWGANAVNGVINIITRPAGDTVGGLLASQVGERDRVGSVRYGLRHGDLALRLYARRLESDAMRLRSGASGDDAWWHDQAGFRADLEGEVATLTVQGDAYLGRLDTRFDDDTRISGGHVMAHWSTHSARGDRIELHGYYDRTDRDIAHSIDDSLDTLDIEYQQTRESAFGDHTLVWGAGHRRLDDRVDNTPQLAFLPADRVLRQTWLFVEDQAPLSARLRLISGLRVADNTYTGVEFLPSVRLAWQPDQDATLWAALSRAVRAPSRLDRELFVPGSAPFVLAGGPGFESEVARVAELGYRAQPTARTRYSVTVFHHDFSRLRSLETAADGSFYLANRIEGRTRGLEAWFEHDLREGWRISGGLTLLDVDLHPTAASNDPRPERLGNDPERQWLLRSSSELPGHLSLDITARHVGRLPAPAVPAYTVLDLRLAWQPRERLELSLAGRNLGDGGHIEFGDAETAERIEPTLQAGLRWTF